MCNKGKNTVILESEMKSKVEIELKFFSATLSVQVTLCLRLTGVNTLTGKKTVIYNLYKHALIDLL